MSILMTSGFPPAILNAVRERWEVLDIPGHRDALVHLQQCDELPRVLVIGYAVAPPPDEGDPPPEPVPTPAPRDLPAHEMLAQALAVDPDLPVIVSTGMAESNAIVYLVQRGAFDYVIEPGRDATPEAARRYSDRLAVAIARAVRWREVVLENRRLRAAAPQGSTSILGSSAGIQRVTQLIDKVAPTPATVLVIGESGTGKELVAQAVHQGSGRSAQPFLGINCGALEDTLLRSELFGHERGAFTGADAAHRGLLREAAGGTLFLDEIATVSATFQVALLRVLEERMARPVGGQQPYPVHCRIVAASNRDLREMVDAGQFRKDLYYRLNVFQIQLPPLRHRRSDLPTLAHHFLDLARDAYGKPDTRFTPAAMDALERHDWPGNIRELRNVIERALILCSNSEIRPADLALPRDPPHAPTLGGGGGLRQELERVETRLIRDALAQTGDNLAAAARLLGLKRPTLHYRIRQLGVR